MEDWEEMLSGNNRNLGPQFHIRGDGAFSPGQHFDQYTEFHTAPYSVEMPYRKDITRAGRAPGHVASGEELKRVAPRLVARAAFVEEGQPWRPATDERGRRTAMTNNAWGNRQVMN